jgi:hypothetical protein
LIGAKLEDRVTPGQIEVVVTVPDRPPFKTRVTALPGAKVEVQVPPFGQSKTTDKKPISKRRQRILLTWGLGALAGTGLITSTALTIKARNDYNSTADGSHCERVPGGIRCDDIGDRQIAHAQHTADIATGFAIGGVLLAGAAAAVYFTAPRDVTVTPTASAGGAGILVRGAF